MPLHRCRLCERPLRELVPSLHDCTVCSVLAVRSSTCEEDVALPAGFAFSFREPVPAATTGYRDLSRPAASGVQLTRRWRVRWRATSGFLIVWGLLFAFVPCAFMLAPAGAVRPSPPPALMLMLMCVGLAGAYVGLANVVNSTFVVVTAAMIQRRHGPLWWPGNASWARAGTEEVVVRRVRANDIRNGGGGPLTPPTCEVRVARAEDQAFVALDQIPNVDDAISVGRALTRLLDATR